MYEDNLIYEKSDFDKKWDDDIIQEFKEKEKLDKDFFPIMTYDMVQCGYPLPNHGEMVSRPWSSTENGNLTDGGGMWCKVEDVKKLLKDNLDLKQKLIVELQKKIDFYPENSFYDFQVIPISCYKDIINLIKTL